MERPNELSRLADAELVSRARTGDDAPYAELFRRHQPAAIALARTLTDWAAADDVVAEAFEKLLMRIRAGGGPLSAFRPYLLQTVRTVAVDASRRTRRLVVVEDPESAADLDASADAGDPLFNTIYQRTTLGRAFGALPDRWQTILWLSFVDGADRDEIATILGINVGGVSALGYRAREGLRRAYLDAHLVSAPTRGCSEVWPMLSGAVRGGLTTIQRKRVDEHVGVCAYCRDALSELDSVNHKLGVLLAPLVLGAAAPAYLDVLGQAHAAGAAAGFGSLEAGTVAKASIASLVKGGAASLAVVASTSTVAIVAMIAVFTAPLGSEPSADPGPDQVVSDVARELGSQPTVAGETSSDSTTGASVTPAVATSEATGTGDPTRSADPSGSPTTTGGPTPTGQPTGAPTTLPTGAPTSTAGPTSGPTKGPTTAPTVGPTSGGPTLTAEPTATPTEDATSTHTPSGTPTPTPTAQPDGVLAQLGGMNLSPRPETPGMPMNVSVPVVLTGGTADLMIVVTAPGMTNFATETGSAYGAWTCEATTPMAGNPKVARLECRLPAATPSDPLDFSLNVNYVGDDAALTTDLVVQAPVVDTSSGDDSAAAELPPTHP